MQHELTVGSLFSGIGGIDLGLERAGMRVLWQVEWDKWCRRVLAMRFPGVKQYADVRDVEWSEVQRVDVLAGGYPCQPFSTAGNRQGEEDDRHLWPEVNRLLDIFRPTWFIGENVAGHISLGLDTVLSDLENTGYAARVFLIPAVAVDAKHRRDRIWIVANAKGERRGEEGQPEPRSTIGAAGASSTSQDVADSGREGVLQRRLFDDAGRQSGQSGRVLWNGISSGKGEEGKALAYSGSSGKQRQGRAFQSINSTPDQAWKVNRIEHDSGWSVESRVGGMVDGFSRWLDEPDCGRVANSVPKRADRLKCLGNSVVPQIPEMIGYAILEAEGWQS